MVDPKTFIVAKRGGVAFAAIVSTITDGAIVVHAIAFSGGTVTAAVKKALELFGVDPEQHVSFSVLEWEVPFSISNERVTELFAAAVKAKDLSNVTALLN